MAEEVKRGPGRPRKEASATEDAKQEAKYGQEFGGTSYAGLDEEFERRNAIDERLEDRRPGTMANRETGEAFEDNRKFAGDLGKAANQMVGRAFITENTSPHPALDNPYATVGGVAYPNQGDPKWVEGEGDEVVIKRNYQPFPAKAGDPLPERLQAGTVTRLPHGEAKRLIKQGVAEFTDDDA
jgi:hypothetical protein